MLSRIAFVLLLFFVLPAPAQAQREGCWPNGAGAFQCSANCRVTACNDYYDGRGRIKKTCRFQCARQRPSAFAPQFRAQQTRPQTQPARTAVRAAPPPPPKPVNEWKAFYSALWSMSPGLQFGFIALVAAYIGVARMGYFDVEPEMRPHIAGLFGYLAAFSVLASFNYTDLHELAKKGWRGELLPPIYGFLSVLTAFLLLRFMKRFLMGWHYMFIAHPATRNVNTAVAHNTALDIGQLRSALTPTAEELSGQPSQWAFQYRTQAHKARALQEKLDADAAMARAAVDRERARRSNQNR